MAVEHRAANGKNHSAVVPDPLNGKANGMNGVANSNGAKVFTPEQKAAYKKKQAFGAQMYTGYIVLYFVLLFMSFNDMLPVFEFEKSLNVAMLKYTVQGLAGTIQWPFVFATLYVVSIFGIQKYMKDKEAFDLRYPLAAWSMFLGVFSLVGSLRTIPSLIRLISNNGLADAVCADTRYDWIQHPAGFWTYVFILSKVGELVDTFFIVFRKGKLITLHWYHHITVMIYCWHAWGTFSMYGGFFSAMNFTVHAFMYIFYFFAAIGYRPTAYAQSITLIQILQMIIGTSVSLFALYHMLYIVPQDVIGIAASSKIMEPNFNINAVTDKTPHCHVNPGNTVGAVLMYMSYLYLFAEFFYRSYITPRPVVSKKID